MIKVAYTNIQFKNKINGLLFDTFTLMQGVWQGCPLSLVMYIIETEVLANFIDADKGIKGVQIGDHEIKLVNFADNITIFLEDITCLNRIQVILKLYEEASSSKRNFSQSQVLQAGAYKNRTDQPGQTPRSKLSIKIVKLFCKFFSQ